jgi:hypothetical protein
MQEKKEVKLGKLEQIPVREIWQHEAHDFTQWLAQEENLNLLSETLDLDLFLLKTEEQVGSFFIDILCETEKDGPKVIIENQLERTNHDHLGKIITYASSVEAKYIIWLVPEVREEHQTALRWLNKLSGDKVSFFLIQMELWSIDNSAPAIRFNIIEQPNDWEQIVSGIAEPGETPEKYIKREKFWTLFNEELKNSKYFKPSLNIPTRYYYNLRMGNANYHIYVGFLQRRSYDNFKVSFYIRDKSVYEKLLVLKDQIDKEFDFKVNWDEKQVVSEIVFYTSVDANDETKWKEPMEDMVKKVDKFKEVFSKYLK